MRWNTRSDPDRSTSTSIFGYAALKACAIASATLTSTDEYQTTLPSFAAASSIAGVVSCASAGMATALHVSSPDISRRAIPVIRLPPQGHPIVMRNPPPCSFGEAAAKLGVEAYANTRFGRQIHARGRCHQQFLSDVDDIVAVASKIGLAAHDARQHVVRFARMRRQQLQIVRLDADAHFAAGVGEAAVTDCQRAAIDFHALAADVAHAQEVAAADEARDERRFRVFV